MTDVLCESCGFFWERADEHAYLQQTAVRIEDVAAASCPKCGEKALVDLEPVCSICGETGRGACICDDPDQQAMKFREQESRAAVSDDTQFVSVEAIEDAVHERVKDIDPEEEQRKAQERREEREHHAQELLNQYYEQQMGRDA